MLKLNLKPYGARPTSTACLVSVSLTRSTKLVVTSTNHSNLSTIVFQSTHCLFTLPIGFEKEINGLVDLVDMKAYTYSDYTDKALVEGEIPADMLEKAKNARSLLVEAAVEADDELFEQFLERVKNLLPNELKAALRKRVLAGDFYLVYWW